MAIAKVLTKKPKRVKFERDSFGLNECTASIQLIEDHKENGKRYGTAFLNIKLPDGRWLPFQMSQAARVPMDKEA